MLRSFLVLALIMACSFGADEEKTYVFKAKGKFAEELKELMKKHAKDGDVVIEEATPDYYKGSRYQNQAPSMLDSFLNNEELSGDVEYGKHIYDRTCYRCHGKSAQKSTYPTARNLNTLTKKELYESLMSYKTDATYGKSSKFIMHEQAVGMTTPEMISVSAYIYSLSHSRKDATAPLNDEDAKKKKEGVQGTYLR